MIWLRVSCTRCTFSGGGYSNASSGTVPAGTVITVTPYTGSSEGYWSGTVSKGPVSRASFTFTVNQNCNFVWSEVIN